MSPAAEKIIDRLDAARQKWWLVSLLTTVVLALCVSLGAMMALMLADVFCTFSQTSLAVVFLVWLALSAALLVGVGRRLLHRQRDLEATARRVETEFPELGSRLINVVQLSEDDDHVARAFCEAAVRRSAAEVGDVPFDRAAERESRWRRFLDCMQTPRDLVEALVVLSVLVAVALVCRSLVPHWSSAASRLLSPWEFVPSVGSVKILKVAPGDADVLIGESVAVSAEIDNPDGEPHHARLFLTPEGEPGSQLVMTADEQHRRYRVALPPILKPTVYRLEIGDSQSPEYTINVHERPTVASAAVTFHYPAYLGRKDETRDLENLDLEAPQYTRAKLLMQLSSPVVKGFLEVSPGGAQRLGRVEQDGRRLSAALPLTDSGSYCVRLWDEAGYSDPHPRVNRIAVLPDRPPVVELLSPDSSATSTAAPGDRAPVVIRADDDHGLGRLTLEMKVQPSDAAPTATPAATVHTWTDFSDGSDASATRRYLLELDPQQIQPGQTVLIRAVAWDNRVVHEAGLDLQPQQGASGWRSLSIVTRQAQASAALERVENLRDAMMKILEKQVRTRVEAENILPFPAGRGAGGEGGEKVASDQWPVAGEERRKERGEGRETHKEISKSPNLQISKSPIPHPSSNSPHPSPLPAGEGTDFSQFTKAAAGIRTRQIDIQKTTVELIDSIEGSGRPAWLSIKRELGALAVGAMLEAVDRCDGLMKIQAASPEEYRQPVVELTAVQERIIDALRKLLGESRRAQGDVLAEIQNRPGGDLPEGVRAKLDAMRAKLDEFLQQQKKVIEASEDLAKTPVEDFTEPQEEALKGLAATEDDWTKFLNELHSDLSKLPEQDFANPSVAQELVEIQVELQWAADALLKKSVELAVPLEQLGAERAEEIKTNLEKWLFDEPDRMKWSQEEPLDDEFKEAPMAELPGELEDMIGQLADQEEDLFDEMEDVSSSWADSLDKMAGWDTLDGPISNMSAKGVTGNALPNASEIGGRSGEGRQGKSSGEFVGDEAVGKGGRRTPSRLTPDPYVEGQIKDHSRESPGGATGGGKESGAGGEGLEGPGRRDPGPRDAQRLAQKQATLRNQAEGIDLKFQVMGFHPTDLRKMIELMAQVERDLKAGRYRNAMRQRKTLAEGLGHVKQYLAGEFEVLQDTTSNLPTDVQRQILDSMEDPSPAGWASLNRRYFERLSAGGDAAGVGAEKDGSE